MTEGALFLMLTQLNPSIPLDTPKGSAIAIAVIDYGLEHHLMWVVIQDETGEIWMWENTKVRGTKSVTLGRIVDNNFLKLANIKGKEQ